MSLPKKVLIGSTLIVSVGLSGCSTVKGLFGSDDDYRQNQEKMVQNLEMPPNLFNPAKTQNATSLALLDAERKALAAKRSSESGKIPTFQADGLRILSNLSERWLEIDSNDSQMIWGQLNQFFNSLGYKIDQERKDIGIMKTAFLERSEVTPTYDQGPITRLLNSWRDQYAVGIYDRFTARVEQADATVKIYFAHHMMYSEEANKTVGGGDNWSLKPSNPVMEAEALYQAMVFFGSTPEKALAQLAATEKKVEVVDGEEFAGLNVQAGFDETWDYLQSAVYRAGWDIAKVNQSKGSVIVKVPETARNEESFLSRLAFWKDKDKTAIPENLVMNVKSEEAGKSFIEVKAPEGESSLNAEQRRYIFESLGLLGQQ